MPRQSMRPKPTAPASMGIVLVQAGPYIDVAEGANTGGDWGWLASALLGVVALVALGAAVWGAARWLRERQSSTPAVAPVNALNRETRKRIRQAADAGQFETAGDLLSRANAHGDAAEAYLKGRAYLKAARSFHASGNVAQAIRCYKQAGEYAQAARLYVEEEEWRAAAAEYLQAGDYELSARYYEKGGDWRRAAENYERAGKLVEAARNYEKSDSPLQAAEAYASYFDEQLAAVDGDLEQLAEARPYARKAGQCYRAAGKSAEASAAFEKGGFLAEAADSLRSSGDYTRAAELLMEADEPMLAARVLEEGGEKQRAFRMRAEAALEEGDAEGAAELFDRGGEHLRAAELYDQLGDQLRAAELYQTVGEHERAAKLFAAAGKPGQAARAAEQAGKLSRAAELYHEAGDVDSEIRILELQGDYFRAGRLLFEHRRFQRAMEVLGHIDSSDPIYRRTLELQGDIYRAQGRFEKAYSRYRSALGARQAAEATLPLYYKMARSLEEEQDLTGALEHYNTIVEVDPHFEDTSLRLGAIRKRLRRSSVAGPSGSGIFAQDGAEAGEQRYEIIDEIARGGMGIVYKARDTVLGRVVAFKILGENLRDNDMAVKYFLREARAAAALSHPNIVTIYDAGEQDGDFYMAMEYVEGTTLKQVIQRHGAFDEDKARFILVHSCRALNYAHSKGVIHRDIKSGNVMMTRDRSLKIMDFGLAKFLREYQNNHTQQVGTPFYMSPEQIIGKDVDFRSDLYSLGCTIFECATGTVPFFKGDLSYHHIHTEPPAPRSINPALSRELEQIILKMLAKSPDDRYQSAKDILAAMGAGD